MSNYITMLHEMGQNIMLLRKNYASQEYNSMPLMKSLKASDILYPTFTHIQNKNVN